MRRLASPMWRLPSCYEVRPADVEARKPNVEAGQLMRKMASWMQRPADAEDGQQVVEASQPLKRLANRR
jgi:hypothetical protein